MKTAYKFKISSKCGTLESEESYYTTLAKLCREYGLNYRKYQRLLKYNDFITFFDPLNNRNIIEIERITIN